MTVARPLTLNFADKPECGAGNSAAGRRLVLLRGREVRGDVHARHQGLRLHMRQHVHQEPDSQNGTGDSVQARLHVRPALLPAVPAALQQDRVRPTGTARAVQVPVGNHAGGVRAVPSGAVAAGGRRLLPLAGGYERGRRSRERVVAVADKAQRVQVLAVQERRGTVGVVLEEHPEVAVYNNSKKIRKVQAPEGQLQ